MKNKLASAVLLTASFACQGAADFRGVAPMCANSNANVLNSATAITLSVAVIVDTTSTRSDIFTLPENFGQASTWRVYTSASNTARIFKDDNALGTDGVWEFPLTFGVWHRLTITHDWSNDANDPSVRVDGIPVTVTEITAPVNATGNPASGYSVGNDTDAFSDFDGGIANLQVLNRVATSTEIFNMENTPGNVFGNSNYRLWLPFDGPIPGMRGDQRGRIYNNAPRGVGGPVAGGCDFAGGGATIDFRTMDSPWKRKSLKGQRKRKMP